MTDPDRRSCLPDGGATRVSIGNWDAVVENLSEFCQEGVLSTDDGRAVCEFPNAQVIVTRDGTVETGMPLHTFEREGVESILVDHERGELKVTTTSDGHRLAYTFHRP
jgi:hypothetical protein